MKTIVMTIAGCVWVVLFAVLGIFTFDTPRMWLAHLLTTKDAQVAAVAVASKPTNATSIASTTLDASAALSSLDTAQPAAVPAKTTYQYQLLSGVAPCKLNQLGADGWHPIQFGGTILSMYGGDAECKKFGITDSLDWALFERATVVPQ